MGAAYKKRAGSEMAQAAIAKEVGDGVVPEQIRRKRSERGAGQTLPIMGNLPSGDYVPSIRVYTHHPSNKGVPSLQ